MKYEDLQKSSKEELVKKADELEAELFQLRVKNLTAQLENKSRIRLVRRDIARVRTRLAHFKQESAS